MTYDPWDVVVVPFPFTDSAETVPRPALVLSHADFNRYGRTVLAMVTDRRNAPWPWDTEIDYRQAGLKMASVVRLKLFTLDNDRITRRLGRLAEVDRAGVAVNLHRLLPLGLTQ